MSPAQNPRLLRIRACVAMARRTHAPHEPRTCPLRSLLEDERRYGSALADEAAETPELLRPFPAVGARALVDCLRAMLYSLTAMHTAMCVSLAAE